MKKIILFALMALCSTMMLAQSKVTVSGTVTAKDDGLGVPGANVLVKGTKQGAFTDADGRYSLVNVPSNATIVITSVGYTTVEIPVNGRAIVNAQLASDAVALDETIVVAYGTAKKGTYTGAASVVKADAIKDVPVSSFENALNGKIAGVQVTQSSGQAGSTTTIQVRGIGSMNASTEPLYVIDGVPATQGNLGQMSDYNYSTNNVMSTLNPDDIESITVLKDAAASSLYGSRAANGVVVITTKRGKAGKPTVKFKASVSISPDWAYNNYELANIYDNTAMMYEVLYDAGLDAGRTEAGASDWALDKINKGNGPCASKFGYKISIDQKTRYPKFTYNLDETNPAAAAYKAERFDKNGNPKFFDWEKALFRMGVFQTYDLSVSGGNDQSTYYSSISYTHDKGRSLDNSFGRVSGRVNVNQKVGKYFEFMTNVNVGRTKNSGFNDTRSTGANFFMQSRNLLWATYWPYNFEMNADGNTWKRVPYTSRYASYAYNYLYYRDLQDDYSRTLKVQASETLTAHLLPGLDARTVFSYDNTQVLDHYYRNAEHFSGTSDKGSVHEITTNYNKMVSSTTLTYNATFAEKHNISLLAGFEAERNKTEMVRASGSNLPGSMDVPAVAGAKDANAYNWGNSIASILSRAEYNYNNKYYLSASYRRDGSSRLSPDERWGNFWSVSGSWRIAQENFIKDISWISDLKLRASYGVNGTLPSSNYGWRNLSSVTSKYQGVAGSALSTAPNPDLTWETNETFNVGLDFGLFDHRLRGSVEWFTRDSKDLLQDVPLQWVTGYSSVLRNIGKINNQGFEVELSGDILRNGDWKWDMGLTASFLKSEVKKLYDGADIVWYDPTGSDNRAQYVYREGESTLAFYGREWAGVNSANGQQVWYANLTDDNGKPITSVTPDMEAKGYFMYNGKVATYDYTDTEEKIIGKAIPKISGGVNTNLSWKGLTLSLNFIYKLGGKLYDGMEKDVDDDGYYWSRTRSKRVAKNRWTKAGDKTVIPLLRGIDLDDTQEYSSRHLHQGDFLRLKTATLSYNLPKKIVSKAGLQNVRVYASGTNLLTWAAFKEVDPEVNQYATRGWEVPFSKTFTFGIELTF